MFGGLLGWLVDYLWENRELNDVPTCHIEGRKYVCEWYRWYW